MKKCIFICLILLAMTNESQAVARRNCGVDLPAEAQACSQNFCNRRYKEASDAILCISCHDGVPYSERWIAEVERNTLCYCSCGDLPFEEQYGQ